MVNGLHYCAVLAAGVLVLIAVTGPVYAFFFMSCVTTRSCNFGTRLHSIGATCAEGADYAEQMLHGEICTLVCNPGYAPTQPAISCNDGTVEGLDVVQCRPVPIRDTRPNAGGLVAGAVTSGEKRTACLRAANLPCDARPGGSSILLQMTGFTKAECDALLVECQQSNSRFHWAQHREANNTCTLGCFAELLSPEDAQAALDRAAAALAAKQALEGIFPVSNDPLTDLRATCNSGPTCVHVSGSCNADDNGDYYRHPLCASGMTQWAQQDGSHRIRYDGKPQFAQAGKWILELGVDPSTDFYGTLLGRQPLYNELPQFGISMWNYVCRTRINSFTYAVDNRKVELTLGSCTCTSQEDCSGNGQAIGDKLTGPNCRCICNDGWTGAHCEVQLCKVPDVLHAAIPACAEGRWLDAGQSCTPVCNPGYAPSSPSFLCGANGQINPRQFRCFAQSALGGVTAGSGVVEETTQAPIPLGPCSRADCFFRGNTIGGRQRDGTCICQCDEGYAGADCRTIVGTCQAPNQKTIMHAARITCSEGAQVPTSCTTQCEEGYYPMPDTLACTGQILVPQSFRCFGGPTVRETWCNSMRYIAISASSIAVLALFAGCCLFGRSLRKEPQNFFAADHLVQVEKDDDGKYNVVSASGRDFRSKLPSHIQNAVRADVIFEPLDEPSPKVNWRAQLEDNASPSKKSNLRQLADHQQALPGVEQTALALNVPQGAEAEEKEKLPGQLSPPPVPRLREGSEVLVQAIDDQPTLNGARGQLVAQEPDSGLWIVALEGRDGVQRLPEHTLAVAAPPPAPAGEPTTTHNQWLMELYDLEGKSQAAKKTQEAQFASLKQQAEEQRDAAISASLEATAAERAEVEAKLRDGLRLGDIEMVRDAVRRAKVVLEQTKGAKASVLNGLVRSLQVAESRLEQFDEREDSRRRKKEYDERVKTGQAADWKMTPVEFWQYAEEGNVERVRAGLKAKLPIFTRSQDGLRRSVVHVACQRTCVGDDEAGARHVEVVRELLAARAHANGVDFDGRTPLDLALSEAAESEAADAPSSREALRTLGLRTAVEAAAEAREGTPPDGSPTSKPSPGASPKASSGAATPGASPVRAAAGVRATPQAGGRLRRFG